MARQKDISPEAQARVEDALGRLVEARRENADLLARLAEADRIREATIVPFPQGGRR